MHSALFLFCILLSACFRHEQKLPASSTDSTAEGFPPGATPPPPMQVRLESTRVLDTVITADVTHNGTALTFVASIDTTRAHPAGGRFDRLQTFAFNRQDSTWHEAMSDTFGVATRAELRDVTGDGHPDLVVATATGLDDSIASLGMVIYSAHSGAWKEVFATQTGKPELVDIDNNGAPEVLLFDVYGGVMPQPDAITYVAEVYSFDGTSFVPSRQRFPSYFQSLAAKAIEEYNHAKTRTPVASPITEEFDFTLYKPCAAVLVAYYSAQDKAGARQFWDREKEYLSRMLPSGQLIDLEAFVKEM